MRFSNPQIHQIRSPNWWNEVPFPSPRNPYRSWPFEPGTQHIHILVPGAAFNTTTLQTEQIVSK